MERRSFLKLCAAGGGVLLSSGLRGLTVAEAASKASANNTTRPNILLALSDDGAFPYASAYGCKFVNTPAFDQIAQEGILFTHAYCAAPTCTATRTGLLTGRNIWQVEEAANLNCDNFKTKYKVYPDILENVGYHVGYTGKGWDPGNSRRTRNPAGPVYNTKTNTPPTTGISNIDYASNFEVFLNSRKPGQPFCFWYGCNEPHRNYQQGSGLAAGKNPADVVVPGFLPDDPAVRSDFLDYGLEIDWFDTHLGRMITKLRDIGELDNTLIVVTGDNGPPFPRLKANCYDGSNHAPMAIRWGNVISGGRVVTDFVSFIDLAPTFLEAAGIALPTTPKEEVMTGKSLMNIFTSTSSGRVDATRDHVLTGRERHVINARKGNLGYPCRALQTDDYLYIHNFEPSRWPAGDPDNPGSVEGTHYADIDQSPSKTLILANQTPGSTYYTQFQLACALRPEHELYDMRTDPDNLTNIADQHTDIRDSMWATLRNLLTAQGDPRVLGTGDVFDSYGKMRVRLIFKPQQ